jgi:hypothetical protein
MCRNYQHLNCDESIHLFLETHQVYEISPKDFFETTTNLRKAHNHTIENLFLYFRLEYHLEKKKAYFYPGAVFIVDNRRYKWFIYDNEDFLSFFDVETFSTLVRKKMSFYSSTTFSDYKKVLVESKFKECVYSLDEVFDEQTYYKKYEERTVKKIKKKIYNKIKYPFLFLERRGDFKVEEITSENFSTIEKIHKDWVDFKLNDPKVFKMMFSSNRYNRCIEESISSKSETLSKSLFYKKIFYWNGNPIAARLCLLKGDSSYDIAFFSKFWEVPSNLVLYINMWCLRDLKENYGIRVHNCGAQLDKYLEMSKHHIPNETKVVYKYNFIRVW